MCGWSARPRGRKSSAVCENLESPLRCVDPDTEAKMKAEVDHVLRAGDSVGGIFEVVARGIPPGSEPTRSGMRSWTRNSRKR